MTPEEAIAIVHSKGRGRTRYSGQEPYLDEVLVAEIERLRTALAKAEAERDEAREWVRRMHAANVTTCVWCGTAFPPGIEPHGVDALREHVTQCERHSIHAEKTRAERAEAAWGRLATECRITRSMDAIEAGDLLLDETNWHDLWRDRHAARAAVDAAGDLETSR